MEEKRKEKSDFIKTKIKEFLKVISIFCELSPSENRNTK